MVTPGNLIALKDISYASYIDTLKRVYSSLEEQGFIWDAVAETIESMVRNDQLASDGPKGSGSVV